MPAELILDISGIDLKARPFGRGDIASYNPHRGALALLDAVVWHDETLDHGVAFLAVRPDAFWTSGHIPGHPIMPGVLLVEAGAQLASYMYYKRSKQTWFAGFTRIESAAFRGLVTPGNDLYILCRCIKYSLKHFVSDVQGILLGPDGAPQVVFDANITGMAFPKVGAVERTPLIETTLSAPQPSRV
ncbi:MAG: hypothetical protein IBJ11_01860 [Phycisphaerales bacterium]|nr:hypothetical protein [Phycisphaerales bacterium]